MRQQQHSLLMTLSFLRYTSTALPINTHTNQFFIPYVLLFNLVLSQERGLKMIPEETFFDKHVVPGARSTLMARFHSARICESVFQ